MAEEKILVPDIGGAENVDVIDVLVKEGQTIAKEDLLITLESEKASMDVPSPVEGIVKSMVVKKGDRVSEGSLILTVETESQKTEKTSTPAENTAQEVLAHAAQPTQSQAVTKKEVTIPNLGGADKVTVIEVSIKIGDAVEKDQTLVTLEGDKASMDVPSPFSGKIIEVKVKKGEHVREGDVIALIESAEVGSITQAESEPLLSHEKKPSSQEVIKHSSQESQQKVVESSAQDLFAGPAVRRLARELELPLAQMKGSGEKGRITRDDVKNFVKQKMQSGGSGFNLPANPKIDFSRFGTVETKPLSKIKKLSGANLHRNWITIPHVTQFEEADITEMEAFRRSEKKKADEKGVKLTPLVFIMKAVVAALKEYPIFNSSLDALGENLVMKKYFHLGVAVNTPQGLVVPVIWDVDQKGLFELARELSEVSQKAREAGLTMAEMQGSCFTISSLGGIGGTAFTPIINAPDVAILGVSRAQMKPIYQEDGSFKPRLMLPLSLSYDHRVIDGADGASFAVYLARCLSDLRMLLL